MDNTVMNKMPERFKNDREVKDNNPWEKVAEKYIDNPKCLFSVNNHYYYEKDYNAIVEFNKKWGETTDAIITSIPVEPWWGNPLTAKLIILSLNPGYAPEINKTLAELLQNVDTIRKKLIEYKKRTLKLNADSLFPKVDDANPITCRDAVNMLGDWYWFKKLKSLQVDVNYNEEEFYKKIAIIEYHGYSSQTSNHIFPIRNKYLETQLFIKKMIWYLAEKDDVRFLIMRSENKWKNLLNHENNDFFETHKEKFLCKKNKGMSQSVSSKNLDETYEQLKLFLS